MPQSRFSPLWYLLVSNNKNQHIVPACYLKGFLASTAPSEHVKNKDFELGVYVSSPDLKSSWQMKGVQNKIFTSSYFYDLSDQTEGRLVVENFLKEVEQKYAKALRSFIKNNFLSEIEVDYVCNFMGTMFLRAECSQKSLQGSIDKLVEYLRDGMGETRDFKKYADGYKNFSKKSILWSNAGRIMKDFGVHFFINNTEVPFITCDNPVIREEASLKEFEALMGDNRCCDMTVKNRAQFFYMSIAPNFAIIASKFIKKNYDGYPYINVFDINIPFKFFLLLKEKSKKYLV